MRYNEKNNPPLTKAKKIKCKIEKEKLMIFVKNIRRKRKIIAGFLLIAALALEIFFNFFLGRVGLITNSVVLATTILFYFISKTNNSL